MADNLAIPSIPISISSMTNEGYNRGVVGFAGGIAFFLVGLAAKFALLKATARRV